MKISLKDFSFEMTILNCRKAKATFVGISQMNCNKYTILVQNTRTKVEEAFDFTDSVYNYEKDIRIKTEEQFAEVLYCVLRDALAVENCRDILDFMEEFGYEDKKACRKAYNGCLHEREQLNNLGIYNYADLVEEMEEKYEL